MLSDAVYLLSTMNHEELVMTIICFFPLMYGTLAFLSTFTGGAAAPQPGLHAQAAWLARRTARLHGGPTDGDCRFRR